MPGSGVRDPGCGVHGPGSGVRDPGAEGRDPESGRSPRLGRNSDPESRIPDPDPANRESRLAIRDSIFTGVSNSLKMRSDDAIAAWRTLNFSDMSLIGRKNRPEYSRNATS